MRPSTSSTAHTLHLHVLTCLLACLDFNLVIFYLQNFLRLSLLTTLIPPHSHLTPAFGLLHGPFSHFVCSSSCSFTLFSFSFLALCLAFLHRLLPSPFHVCLATCFSLPHHTPWIIIYPHCHCLLTICQRYASSVLMCERGVHILSTQQMGFSKFHRNFLLHGLTHRPNFYTSGQIQHSKSTMNLNQYVVDFVAPAFRRKLLQLDLQIDICHIGSGDERLIKG